MFLELGASEIEDIIPHRKPMRLVGHVWIAEDGCSASGEVRLTGNEFFFSGHFPNLPITPGWVVAEAICQVGACLIGSRESVKDRLLPLLTGIREFSWGRPVLPGALLEMEFAVAHDVATIIRKLKGEGRGRASVGGVTVAEGLIAFELVPRQLLERLLRQRSAAIQLQTGVALEVVAEATAT